jgi:ribosome-binding ATPase
MSLSIGLVGLPNVGKSTLFNALTKQQVLAANYPFATISPNVGIVAVPDQRLQQLATLYPGAKVVPASVTFVDIAGLVKGAAEGQGLGNQFLAHIRESSAICQVVRVFSDSDVVHVDGEINPSGDIETINTELILADLQTLSKRLPKLESDAKKDPKLKASLALALQLKQHLNAGSPTHSLPGITDEPAVADLQLLTAKPFIYLFNLDESDLINSQKQIELTELVAPAQAVFACAKVEAELSELPAQEAAELLSELGQTRSGLEALSQVSFRTLGLQTFLTAGPKEVRAWTIPQGATAPEAAGVIHTDFQKGFIKAETVDFEDLMLAGSMTEARSKGKVRLEGKDYIMREGDVVEFRFNL